MLQSMAQVQALALGLLMLGGANAFLPAIGPTKYQAGASIPIYVNELKSVTQPVPYSYYHLAYCPVKSKETLPENLGEVLEGDLTETSSYKVAVEEQVTCQKVCEIDLGASPKNTQSWAFVGAIKEEYNVHMTLDGLPVAVSTGDSIVHRGFPVGQLDERGNAYLHNHLRFTVAINPVGDNRFNVVGFLVEPFSHDHASHMGACPGPEAVAAGSAPGLKLDSGTRKVTFSYDVMWQRTSMPWTQRWDIYMATMENPDIHWFSIINSSAVVLFLTTLVAVIMVRALRTDIQQYNREDIEEVKEESGWKLIHGDVLRPPSNFPMLLAVCIGTGVQLLVTVFVVLSFTAMGLLSPNQRGAILTAIILVFVLTGSFAGYYSARLHRAFRGTSWLKTTLATAGLYPAICCSVFFFLNGALALASSSAAVSFGTLLLLLLLWLLVQTPLVFLGSYFGFKAEPEEEPVRINQIARQIPEQEWYLQNWATIPVAGILPFGAISVELFFIFTQVWLDQVYFIFGFLLLVLVILLVTCAEVSTVLCYFKLCGEDHRWWWSSLFWSGACAIYTLMYSAWYFSTQLHMTTFLSAVIYFSYTGLLALSLGLMTGCVGVFSCLWFIRKIYGSIKVD
ncbi:unnamed protein product [Chrysoparadoxa australica]